MLLSMIVGYVIAIFGVLLLAVAWRQIHRGVREGRLVTDGACAHMRHPQYTGLFLAIFGERIVHWPTVFSCGFPHLGAIRRSTPAKRRPGAERP